MSARPRPLLAVRLIGPAAIVTAQKTHLIAYFVQCFGGRATCRTSTRPAARAGDIRVYLTVTPKGEG